MNGGYRGEDFAHWIIDVFRWIVEVVLRPLEKKGFTLLPKPWVVERTFGWLNWCRRLSKDYERLPETSETLIYIAMIRNCNDTYHGEATCMICNSLRLLKHPLR